MTLLQRIARHAAQRPAAMALRWRGAGLSYAALLAGVEAAMAQLSQLGVAVVALDMENGPDWVLFDIAGLALDLCVVPLPPFFSAAQLRHAVTRAGVQAIITDRPDALRESIGDLLENYEQPIVSHQRSARWLTVTEAARRQAVAAPVGIHKLTFTSGTTGAPKGVPLSWAQMRAVTVALVDTVELQPHDLHLTLMPLAVLLENIAGVYAALWAGAGIVLAPMQELGVNGAARVDGVVLAGALLAARASTAIFTPQTLQALVEAVEQEHAARPPLRFGAVGGAPVSPRLLQRAAMAGLPIYEGYGLSECSSVVCLNRPAAHRPGSVGRPLPHVDLTIAPDGEVVVRNSDFPGYFGEERASGSVWRTGDIGEIDDEGFLHLHGRRRNVFITAFGRNVSPEWVERELTLEAPVDQAAVFGEARPFNVAVIHPTAGVTSREIEKAIARANSGLPDYARISRWVWSDEAFSPRNGMLTGTGRIRREKVWSYYRDAIESIYYESVFS